MNRDYEVIKTYGDFTTHVVGTYTKEVAHQVKEYLERNTTKVKIDIIKIK